MINQYNVQVETRDSTEPDSLDPAEVEGVIIDAVIAAFGTKVLAAVSASHQGQVTEEEQELHEREGDEQIQVDPDHPEHGQPVHERVEQPMHPAEHEYEDVPPRTSPVADADLEARNADMELRERADARAADKGQGVQLDDTDEADGWAPNQ